MSATRKATFPLSIAMSTAILATSAAHGASFNQYEPNMYVGANAGSISINSSEFTNDDDGYQVFVGTRLMPFLSAQVGFHDFGNYSNSTIAADTKGYSLTAVGDLPITDDFGLFARVGNLWWDSDFQTASSASSANDQDIFFGVGAMLSVTDQLDFTLSYDRYRINADSVFIDGDLAEALEGDYDSNVNHAAIGLNFSF